MALTRTYQLQKYYGSGVNQKTRIIHKPVEDTILVAINSVATTDFGVDTTNGTVIFENAPTGVITVGFEFDVPLDLKMIT